MYGRWWKGTGVIAQSVFLVQRIQCVARRMFEGRIAKRGNEFLLKKTSQWLIRHCAHA